MEVDSNFVNDKQSQPKTISDAHEELRECMLLHLLKCNDVHFKSQQIGEPDLTSEEKRAILENILNCNHSTFLSRFGHYLLAEHLSYFNTSEDKESYEVQFYLTKLGGRKVMSQSKVQIKNRRFQAMKKLMSEGEYFSVGEMRKRNPLLFDQLLGNFVKNPRTEFNNVEQYQVAHILLDQMEQDQIAALKKSQLDLEMEEAENYSSSDDAVDDDEGYNTRDTLQSASFSDDIVDRVPWGTTYKNEHVIGRTRWKNKHGGERRYVSRESDLTQEEKLLLINEFTSSMINSFLQGKDEFDYSEVDNNPDYDDMDQCEIDEQEKYFDSESPEEIDDNMQSNIEDDLDEERSHKFKSNELVNEFKNMKTEE